MASCKAQWIARKLARYIGRDNARGLGIILGLDLGPVIGERLGRLVDLRRPETLSGYGGELTALAEPPGGGSPRDAGAAP
jgi:hypothetical protein